MSDPIGFPGLGLSFDPSRVAFSLFGHDIYWYGIIIAAAFLLAVVFVVRRSPRVGVPQETLIDALLFGVPSAIVGARLYYFVFNLEYFQPTADNPNPAKIYEIWRGGIAIYGAVIGALLAALIFCKVRKISFYKLMDIAVYGLLIGQAIGRWGNFINREAYGGPTGLPWGMKIWVNTYDGVRQEFTTVHPTFLYESLWCALGFVLLVLLFKRRKFNGQIFLGYVAWYGLGRAVIEGLRTDSLYLWGTDLRVSQLVAIVSCLLALGLLAYHLFFKEHDPAELADTSLRPVKMALSAKKVAAISPESTEPPPDTNDTADNAADASPSDPGPNDPTE